MPLIDKLPRGQTGNGCLGIIICIYRYGNMAYIGGGFGSGIHNTLEAAVYGIPVIFGPNFAKFHEAKELLACGGAFTIDSETSFIEQFDALNTDSYKRLKAGKLAGEMVLNGSGGTEKVLNLLRL